MKGRRTQTDTTNTSLTDWLSWNAEKNNAYQKSDLWDDAESKTVEHSLSSRCGSVWVRAGEVLALLTALIWKWYAE